jgi:prostaglandin-endoperoxide synthase 2
VTGAFWRKYGVKNGARIAATTHFRWFWRLMRRTPALNSVCNRMIINSSIYTMKTRPGALSTMGDYTSWESLRDRTYNRRHLRGDPDLVRDDRPPLETVTALFERPAGRISVSGKSTLLFPLFAQWFVDGFLRTDPTDPRKNTSTHDIDLSQLYGQTKHETDMLRGEDGLLRTSTVDDQEFPPFYYDNGEVAPAFTTLPIALTSNDPKTRAVTTLSEEVKRNLFALGIPRGNIHYGFVMMSTLFLREHNRIARAIRGRHPDWTPDRIFETTRNTLIVVLIKVVIEDYINHITPIHFPLFVEAGIGARERWYRQNWMSTEFNLLYRWHSLIPTKVTVGGVPSLFSALEWDTRPVTTHGLAKLFDEASRQPCSTISLLNTDPSLLPIEAVSIGVGRLANLASFNAYRKCCGFPPLRSFEDLSSNSEVREAVRACYRHIDKVEFFPGLFAEDVRDGATLPPLMATMVAVDAFSQALTNPLLDPNLFTADTFSEAGMDVIAATSTLSDIVKRNIPGESVDPLVSLTRRDVAVS